MRCSPAWTRDWPGSIRGLRCQKGTTTPAEAPTLVDTSDTKLVRYQRSSTQNLARVHTCYAIFESKSIVVSITHRENPHPLIGSTIEV